MNINIPELTPEMSVDVACAAVFLVFVVWGAVRGLSSSLARIASLLLAFKSAFLIYPRMPAILPQGSTKALAVCLTALAAFLVYLATRAALERVTRAVLSSPLDRVLGALVGAVKGILLVFVVFSAIALATPASYGPSAFAKSRTGSRLVPVVWRIIAPAGVKSPFSSAER